MVTKITKHKMTGLKKALKSVLEKKGRQQRQNEKLLCAIKRRDPTQVRACVANGAQADGEDENGHTFMVLADSAYGYDASREQHLDDMYRILASGSLNPRKPRIIDVGGLRFNVHDPSPTHRTGDLGVLPELIEGDDNFGKMETHAAMSKPWIDRDPRWFSMILDFYHMGKHMPMSVIDGDRADGKLVTRAMGERQKLQLLKLQYLGDLLREVEFYAIDEWLKTKIEKEYKQKVYVQKLLQKAKMLLPFLLSVLQPGFRNGSYDCRMKLEVDGITPPHGMRSLWYEADRVTKAICIAVQEELSWTLTLYLTVHFNGTATDDQTLRDRWNVADDLESNNGPCMGLAQFDYQEDQQDRDDDRRYDRIVITGYDIYDYRWGGWFY